MALWVWSDFTFRVGEMSAARGGPLAVPTDVASLGMKTGERLTGIVLLLQTHITWTQEKLKETHD